MKRFNHTLNMRPVKTGGNSRPLTMKYFNLMNNDYLLFMLTDNLNNV